MRLFFWTILMLSPISYADDVFQFNINGSIAATTCNIKMPTQLINLGAWQAQSHSGIGSGVGNTSDKVEYSLDFDCPKGLKITGQLEGNQYNVSNIYSIALENTPQSASGVVIEIHFQNASSQWQSLVYGSQRTLIEKTKDGINSVKLRSFYEQVDSIIKPGRANSSVTLNITYQ